MRLVWKSLDKMRCLRKRSTIPFLGFLITFLLFLNLYIEDGYVLVCTFSLLPASPDIPRHHDGALGGIWRSVGPALLRPAAAFQQTRPTSLECSPTEQMRLCFFALPMSALLKLVFEEGTFKNVTAGTQLKPSR